MPQDNDTLGRERCRNAELNSMKYETDLFFDAYLEEKSFRGKNNKSEKKK